MDGESGESGWGKRGEWEGKAGRVGGRGGESERGWGEWEGEMVRVGGGGGESGRGRWGEWMLTSDEKLGGEEVGRGGRWDVGKS